MQRMGFTAPTLETLIHQALGLSGKYHLQRAQGINPVRERQMNEIEAVHHEIQALLHATSGGQEYPKESLRNASVGIWICVLESIEQEYIGRNPLPAKGRLFGHGSVLSELITSTLNLSTSNTLNDTERLMYLAEAHQFIAGHFHTSFNTGTAELLRHVEESMSSVLARMMKSIKKLMDAVPTAEVLQTKFSTLYHDYAKKRLVSQPFYATSVDEDRPFCAQLGQVVASMLCVDTTSQYKSEMDRHNKVMLGLLIYMMRTIKGYKSELYNLCEKMMSGGPGTLSNDAQYDCLVTLDTFLKDNDNVQHIAKKGHEIFGKENRLVNLDTKLRIVQGRIDNELKTLHPDQTNPMIGSKALGLIGALAVYPIGYGTGKVLGTVGAGAEMRSNTRLKEFITAWINENAHYLLGMSSGGVGYLATTPIITAVYQTVAGNLLGAAFAIAGGVITGFAGYLVVDLVLRSLYKYTLQATSHHKDPLYATNFDRALLANLEALPDSVLDASVKVQLARVTGYSPRFMPAERKRGDESEVRECGMIQQTP